ADKPAVKVQEGSEAEQTGRAVATGFAPSAKGERCPVRGGTGVEVDPAADTPPPGPLAQVSSTQAITKQSSALPLLAASPPVVGASLIASTVETTSSTADNVPDDTQQSASQEKHNAVGSTAAQG
ncbi:unnamed protein product, partial [Laminaria digitata]